MNALEYFTDPRFRFIRWGFFYDVPGEDWPRPCADPIAPDGTKARKSPVKANGRMASVTEPANYLTHADAVAAHAAGQRIGLVLGDGVAGFDLDDCFEKDADGNVTGNKPWVDEAATLVPAGAYWEQSVSGKGLHAIFMIDRPGEIPNNLRRRYAAGEGEVEFYTDARFFALGTPLQGNPTAVQTLDHITSIVPTDAGLAASWEDTDGPVEGYDGPTDDGELLERARVDFMRWPGLSTALFFQGDPETAKHVNSQLDMSVANDLAFLTGCDGPRMERIMRSLPIARSKWDKHKDYLRKFTIMKAIGNRKVTGQYQGGFEVASAYKMNKVLEQISENPVEWKDHVEQIAKLSKDAREDLRDQLKAFGIANSEFDRAVKDQVTSDRRAKVEERGLIADKDGNILQTMENVRRFFANEPLWQDCFALNTDIAALWIVKPFPGMKGKPAPRRLTDADSLIVTSQLQGDVFPTIHKAAVWDAIVCEAEDNQHSPIKQYLEGLVWDGQPRLAHLFSYYIPCEMADHIHDTGVRFMVSAVARGLNPGAKVDAMPVVSGPQGFKKSTAFNVLAGDDWFGDDMPHIRSGSDKSTKEWLHQTGVWIAEIAEMASLGGKAVEDVKQFLATQRDIFRPAYGKTAMDKPRGTVFVGTTNDDNYLVDVTGNRRFWPLKLVDMCRIDELSAARDQLWAEAVVAYRSGTKWWFDQGECASLDAAQDAARFSDIDEDRVADFLRQIKDHTTSRSVALACFDDQQGDSKMTHRISRYMRALGWKAYQQRIDGKMTRTWVRTAKAEPYGAATVGDAPPGTNVVPLR